MPCSCARPCPAASDASPVATLVLLLASLPILTMITMSFGASGTLEFPPREFSLHWYRAAWQTFVSSDAGSAQSMGAALTIDLVVAVATMLIATAVSVPAAYALSRYRFRGRALVEQLVALPIVYPLVMLGLALLIVFNALPVELGIVRLVVAHVILTLPFTVKNCAASVASIGPDFEEAACLMGASAPRRRRRAAADAARHPRRHAVRLHRVVQRIHGDVLPVQHRHDDAAGLALQPHRLVARPDRVLLRRVHRRDRLRADLDARKLVGDKGVAPDAHAAPPSPARNPHDPAHPPERDEALPSRVCGRSRRPVGAGRQARPLSACPAAARPR